jgi:hypothetical protein
MENEMTNVIDLTNHKHNQDALSKDKYLNDLFKVNSDIFFPVASRPAGIINKTGDAFIKDHNHKYLVRTDPEAEGGIRAIGLVGDGFKWFDNRTFFGAMQEEIVNSGVSLENLQVKDSWAFHGARCKREYIFHDVTLEPEVGDTVAFRLYGWNTFDGSMSWRIGGGALRLICTNGMTSMVDKEVTVRKHTSGASIPALTQHIKMYIDVFYQQGDLWKGWIGKIITDEEAELCFSRLPGMSESLLKKFMETYMMQIRTTGRTVWSMYNVATYWASHDQEDNPFVVQKTRDTGTNHEQFTLYQREQRVRQWIGGSAFMRLAA